MLDYFQTGAFLGTSKETTLRGVLQNNFVRDIRINDVTLRGSDTVQSILTFGASSILRRGVLVDLQVGIRLTNVAPNIRRSSHPPTALGAPGFDLDQLPEATWGKAAGCASLPSSRLATKAACVRFVALSFFRMLPDDPPDFTQRGDTVRVAQRDVADSEFGHRELRNDFGF